MNHSSVSSLAVYPSRRTIVLTCLALYFFALLFRLPGLGSDTPQPDEHHWLVRMHQCVTRYHKDGIERYNTHLGHPGVTPVLVMLASHWLQERYNAARGLEPGEAGYLDELTAVRAGIAIIAALVVPIFFFGCLRLLGYQIALLAAALIALSPGHIAVSRLAHLDAILTLIITSTVLLYAAAERTGRLSLKLLAGAVWGLGIATKPTAGFLVIGLLLYKLLRKLVLGREDRSITVLAWSDIWALMFGHGVFALLYMRLWQTNSRYVVVYDIHNRVTRTFEAIGNYLDDHLFVVALVLSISALSAYRLLFPERTGTAHWGRHVAMIWLLFAPLTVVLSIDSDVPQNIVRYWLWAAGLSKKVHDAYGIAWEAPPMGYLSIYLQKLPSLVLIGIVLGALSLSLELLHLESREVRERWCFCALFLVAAIAWTSLLNISSKQTFRYVIPVLPGLVAIASLGLTRTFERFRQSVVKSSRDSLLLSAADATLWLPLLLGVLLLQLAATLSRSPDYALFSNVFAGGVAAEIEGGRSVPVVGTNEVLHFLDVTAHDRKRDLVVMVLGDLDILDYTYRRLRPNEEDRIRFLPFRNLMSADYLLVFPGFQSRANELVNANLSQFPLAFNKAIDGVPMLSLYELPIADYHEPVEFSIRKASRKVGALELPPPTLYSMVVARANRQRAGHIFFGVFARVSSGTYRITYPVGIPGPIASIKGFDPTTPVVQLEFGNCQRVVTLGELDTSLQKPFSFDCTFPVAESYQQIRGYWFGKASVQVGSPLVQRID